MQKKCFSINLLSLSFSQKYCVVKLWKKIMRGGFTLLIRNILVVVVCGANSMEFFFDNHQLYKLHSPNTIKELFFFYKKPKKVKFLKEHV